MTASVGLAQDMAASLAPEVAAASVMVATAAPQDFVVCAAIIGFVVVRAGAFFRWRPVHSYRQRC
jgi:hypothetical protein